MCFIHTSLSFLLLTLHYESQSGTSTCCYHDHDHDHGLDLPVHLTVAAETVAVVVAGDVAAGRRVAAGTVAVGEVHQEDPEHGRKQVSTASASDWAATLFFSLWIVEVLMGCVKRQ